MTSVVTGASGHLGGNLVRHLLERGEDVRVVVHRNTAAIEGLDVERVQASVHDPASLRAAFAGADTVYHLVAKISIDGDSGGAVWRTNVDGARHAAQAALDVGVGRYVHVSSVHAFDMEQTDGTLNEGSPRSVRPAALAYDRSKYAGEKEVRKLVEQGLEAVIVNPTGVIGPHDFAPSRMGQVFLDLANKRLPALVAGGFDWVDVRDLAVSMVAAAERGEVGENYLLGGHFHRVPDLARMAAAATGVPAPRMVTPIWLARLGVPFARWSARRHGAEPKFTHESMDALAHACPVDHGKAARALGHAPRPTKNTVRDVYDWFEDTGAWQR